MQQPQRFIEIAIKQCRNGGIDCKVHGIQLVGRHSAHALPMDDTTAFSRLLPPDFEFEQVSSRISLDKIFNKIERCSVGTG